MYCLLHTGETTSFVWPRISAVGWEKYALRWSTRALTQLYAYAFVYSCERCKLEYHVDSLCNLGVTIVLSMFLCTLGTTGFLSHWNMCTFLCDVSGLSDHLWEFSVLRQCVQFSLLRSNNVNVVRLDITAILAKRRLGMHTTVCVCVLDLMGVLSA